VVRVLLATGDDPRGSRLRQRLEATGHEVIRLATGGEGLLTSIQSIQEAGRLHAAILSHGALGRRWPRLLRQLCKRAPYLPVILLLDPKADRAWRLAMLAGAFEAVPASASEGAGIEAVHRALAYAVGRIVGELLAPRTGGTSAPGLARDVAPAARTR
jgi:DNA-binding NarL/FixJ family response regulator